MFNISARGLASLALWGAVMLWSGSFIVLKLAFTHFDPMVVIFGRMLIASLAFVVMFRRLGPIAYQPGDWKLLLFMGICEPGFYFVFEALALTNTDASQAGMICALLPVLMAVAARVVLKERITARAVMGFGLAVAGAVILSAAARSTSSAPNPILGNFYEFMAMVFATGYMISLKQLTVRYNPWFLTMVQAVVGTLFFFPLLFLPTTVLPTSYPMAGVAAVVFLGLGVTILAYGLYNYAMSKVPANQASAYVNLIPVITVVMGWLILGERLTPLQYAASVVVLAGVYLSQVRETPRPVTQE